MSDPHVLGDDSYFDPHLGEMGGRKMTSIDNAKEKAKEAANEKQKAVELEKSLTNLVRQFEEETGLTVEGIDFWEAGAQRFARMRISYR